MWISVKDRLPVTTGTYIAMEYTKNWIPATDEVYGCWFNNGKFYYEADADTPFELNPTHWMPLPELPKDII